MDPDKYYVLTDIDDPYENCLDYHGPYHTESEALLEAIRLKELVWTAAKKPYYSSVTIVKTIKF